MEELELFFGDDYNDNYVEEGECPNCNGIDIEYVGESIVSFDRGEVRAKWICKGCQTEGIEVHEIQFVSHIIKVKHS
jgi:hypothetical protein